MKIPIVIAGLSILLVAGCRRGPETWSCNNLARHACSQWTVVSADKDTIAKQQASCTAMGGYVISGPCSDQNVVGSCFASGEGGSRIVYYAPRDPSDAQRSCAQLGGTWR